MEYQRENNSASLKSSEKPRVLQSSHQQSLRKDSPAKEFHHRYLPPLKELTHRKSVSMKESMTDSEQSVWMYSRRIQRFKDTLNKMDPQNEKPVKKLKKRDSMTNREEAWRPGAIYEYNMHHVSFVVDPGFQTPLIKIDSLLSCDESCSDD